MIFYQNIGVNNPFERIYDRQSRFQLVSDQFFIHFCHIREEMTGNRLELAYFIEKQGKINENLIFRIKT